MTDGFKFLIANHASQPAAENEFAPSESAQRKDAFAFVTSLLDNDIRYHGFC